MKEEEEEQQEEISPLASQPPPDLSERAPSRCSADTLTF